ncbi:MAG: choice-of-anchor tandem repeat GloVer-containing protein [Syntrophobacteraceae bacterium]
MRIKKGFERGLVIGISVFICIMAGVLGNPSASQAAFEETTLHSFRFSDGASPRGSLTLSGSTLYGMTLQGGAASSGTIFKINTDGTGYQILHSFGNGTDGGGPYGSLTLSGTTLYGMSIDTIFKINTDGTGYQILHSFGSIANDGASPRGSLTLSGSTLYGMTLQGGTGDPNDGGDGTIFKINTDGTGYQVIHNFSGGIAFVYGSLTLSGTTLYGMSFGTIFQINTDGTGYQIIHNFGSIANDGAEPYGSLTLSGTTLYGMTSEGGCCGSNIGNGTIFKINTDSTGYQILYSFGSVAGDGGYPVGSLTISGTTLYGMAGTIFQINTDGTGFQVLYTFCGGCEFGAPYSPWGDLTLSGTTLYGMTAEGGDGGYGTILSLSPTPPIPPSGKVPRAPTGVKARAGNALATVNFKLPANGGSPITVCTVTSKPGGVTHTGAGSPINVPGLTNGIPYTFRVTATNAVGTGKASEPSNKVIPATVPDAPTIGTAVAGNAEAKVSFSPPASNGGSHITSYTVTSSAGQKGKGTKSPITVKHLTNGDSYTFTVTARNRIGTGPASSSSNSVTPTK